MNKFRLAGWLAVGGLLGAALLAPSAAFATVLHDSHQGTSWNDKDFQGSSEECKKHDLGAGDVVWHFVLTSPDEDSGHLTAKFQNAGEITVANADSPAAVLHFYIWTGHDTLLDAETTDVDGGNLNLSHICAGKEEASESVPVETEVVESQPVETHVVESQPVETEVVESQPVETEVVESQPVETEVVESQPVESTPVESVPVESVPVESTPVESTPVESVPVESVPVVTPCADCTPATHGVPTPTPKGSVEAETGTPNEDVTPPSTDTLTPTNSTPSNDGWQLVLIALAALIASALVLTPASRKIRR